MLIETIARSIYTFNDNIYDKDIICIIMTPKRYYVAKIELIFIKTMCRSRLFLGVNIVMRKLCN